ncbi:methyltransferase domain-containing protein [Marixanthomonas ophiurae]|uniref:Methyltransferase domain-containing protein n=1 Tax=Marixanthomonas ophiurae TaxID=387659 RepID=A0A3E1QAH5_9FLAO|nr:methyltransferase domain-containing protein [Marixanthomonas ophiurae]RFN59104.1 methyltransferase domain-containing protein [Marixanthomonas ophiurae]
MESLNEPYWDNRYKNKDTKWDIGYVSTPLKTYFDQLTDNKNLKILIPGGGNSYEAEYLHEQGFAEVYVVDVSETALQNFKKRVPTFPSEKLLHQDFFKLEETFDLIIEQTFFCALDPSLRNEYVAKMHQLLKPKGKLIGLLFNFPLTKDGPPFGGSKTEYKKRFAPFFEIKVMETAYNSIPQRQGNELFVILQKK